MTAKEQEVFTKCVAEGVKRALLDLKLVDETPHPVTSAPMESKTIGQFVSKDVLRNIRNAACSISLAACAFAFASCASAPQLAPKFVAPSVAPVEQAVTRVEQHVQGAQGAATKLASATTEPCKTKEWQDAYTSLTQELNDSYLATQSSKAELEAYKTQVETQTASCNNVATAYNKIVPQLIAVEASRHGWVKRFWIAAGVSLLLAAWVTKGLWIPILGAI